MKQAILTSVLFISVTCLASGQSADNSVKFEIADVHASPKTNPLGTRLVARAGRYEAKNASMLDLVRAAYGFQADKILGGPVWLEMDHFDILAKLPPASSPESIKLMLQALLADRFQLVVHKENKPLPTYALRVGKKPLLKEADGSEQTGCKTVNTGTQGSPGVITMMVGGTSGPLSIGPDRMLLFNCRNMTMAAFVEGLPRMMATSLGINPLVDETGLKGEWNFDLTWSISVNVPGTEGSPKAVTVFDAVDKQLGLKLEHVEVPIPVLVVDSAKQNPSANPPGIDAAFPPIVLPTEFEVASIKPSDPTSRSGMSPAPANGKFTSTGMPLRFLVDRAFNSNLRGDQVFGMPEFAQAERYDIVAKAPALPAGVTLDNDNLSPMIRALLVDRFKMTYHSENRPLPAYTLVAAKPKLKKADPANRASCKTTAAPSSAGPGSQTLACQNVTLTQFAERLRYMSAELSQPVENGTGIEGTWDISFTYSQRAGQPMGGRGGGGAGGGESLSAADPTGGMTLFEAVEKQLGLKLEKHERPVSVIVIDHLEQKPTEN